MSKGQFQFDLWGAKPSSGRWNWEGLRERVRTHGIRNSLLIGSMPTASTSQILGNNECFEPYTANPYTRRVLSGEFWIVNTHLVRDLQKLGLWNQAMKDRIVAVNGSVQNIPEIPSEIRTLYKTVWEISQRRVLDLAADRGAFIDQSQNLNIHMAAQNIGKLSSMHFHE